MTVNELPGTPSPFKLEAGEGQRFAFGRHLATLIARPEDIGMPMAGSILSGAKGAHFPLHHHASSHEAIYVMEGSISFTLGDSIYTLLPGDYVNIPAGTAHGFTYLDHRGKMIAWSFNGNAQAVYAALGEPYQGTVYSESLPDIDWGRTIEGVDIAWIDHTLTTPTHSTGKLDMAPDGVVPFVLSCGEGERLIAGEQVYTLMGVDHNSSGAFHSIMTEGPIGPAIPKHMHEKICETFFCLNGGMEMIVGDTPVSLAPGDFVYVPAGTPHSYQILKHATRFIGFLTPGYFEQFFRYLGQPFDGHIYPLVPHPFRFDRVIQHLAELDLKLLGRPGGGPPPPAGPPAS